MNYQEALNKLKQFGEQEHVLKYFDHLTETQQADLLAQIEATDFSPLLLAKDKENQAKKGVISPLAAMQLAQIDAEREQFEKIGLEAIRAGKVGAVLLAGGMGTRLGSDAPKGMYNIGETKDVFIFQRIIENLQDVVRAAQTPVHLFVMTSDKNNEVTIAFFKDRQPTSRSGRACANMS